MSKQIRNGSRFPQEVKLAALKASKKANKPGSKTSVSAVAKAFNISKATLCTWRRAAGIQQQVPAGIARHIASAHAERQFNTPIIQPNGTIMLRGQEYKA